MEPALVVLDAFPNVLVAEMVKDRLGAEGIAAFVADENTGHLLAGVEAAMGGIRVLVAPEDLEPARGVLANLSHPLGSAVADLSEEELGVLAAEADTADTDGEAGVEPEPAARRERRLRLLFLLLGVGALAFLVIHVLLRARAAS
jgi:hypothetical protein